MPHFYNAAYLETTSCPRRPCAVFTCVRVTRLLIVLEKYLDKPRGFGGGKDAVGLEPQIQAFPLEHLLVENDELGDKRWPGKGC